MIINGFEEFDFNRDLYILSELVNINSQSRNFEAVNICQRYIGQLFNQIGCDIQYLQNPERDGADLLIAEYGSAESPIINFICHSDTVLKNCENYSFYINQGKAFGPGIADDKAGIVIIYKYFEYALNQPNFPFRLRMICSPSEEIGSLGWHNLFQVFGKEASLNLGFEPALTNGDIITSRNGNRWYNITVKGKAAHAGRFNEPCINASHELSSMIFYFHSLNDYANKLKVNVGSFGGGTGNFNIVCGDAWAKLDVRFPCFDSRDSLHQRIIEVIHKKHTSCFLTNEFATCFWTLEDDCPPLPYNNLGESLIHCYLKTCSLLEDRSVGHQHSGGAADINYFTTKSNINIDGLGAVGSGLHTKDEFIEISTLESRFFSLKALIQKHTENLYSIAQNEQFYGGDNL